MTALEQRKTPLPTHRMWGGLAVAALALAVGCATTRVETTERSGTDWSSFRTYDQTGPADTPLDREIREQIALELEAKGLEPASGSADLLVSYVLVAEERSRRRNAGDPDVDLYITENYLEKHLEIEVRAGQGGEVLWTAIGRNEVLDADHLEATAKRAVRDIFARFPKSASPPS